MGELFLSFWFFLKPLYETHYRCDDMQLGTCYTQSWRGQVNIYLKEDGDCGDSVVLVEDEKKEEPDDLYF